MSVQSVFVRTRFTWLAYVMLAYYAYFFTSLGPLMPFLRDELHLNYTEGGLHFSAFAFGVICGGLSADGLTRRFGRRRVFWSGGIGMALGAASLTLGQNAAITILSTLAMGGLGSMLLVSIQAGLADEHRERRAIAFTESNIAASISSAFAPVLIGELQRAGLGWRAALYLPIALYSIAMFRFGRDPMPERSQQVHTTTTNIRRRLPAAFWAYWFVVVLGNSVEWSIIYWGADFLEKVVGFEKASASTIMGIFLGAMVIGRIIGSGLSRRYDTRKLLLGAVSLAAVGFPFLWLSIVPPLNVFGLFIVGLGVANWFPLTLSVALNLAEGQSNTASARISFGTGVGSLVAPQVLGTVADGIGIHSAYGIVLVLLLITTALVSVANRVTSRRANVT